MNEAEARLGEIHSFDTDLLGAGEAWEQARRGPSPDEAGAGGEDTSLQDVTCGGGRGGGTYRGLGKVTSKPGGGREGGWERVQDPENLEEGRRPERQGELLSVHGTPRTVRGMM